MVDQKDCPGRSGAEGGCIEGVGMGEGAGAEVEAVVEATAGAVEGWKERRELWRQK